MRDSASGGGNVNYSGPRPGSPTRRTGPLEALLDFGELRPDLRSHEDLRVGGRVAFVALPRLDRLARLGESGLERPGFFQRLAEQRLREICRIGTGSAAERRPVRAGGSNDEGALVLQCIDEP